MEVFGANGVNHDIEEQALKSLLETFGSVFTLQEISSAYRSAGRNVDLAGEILSDKQANISASTTPFSYGELRGEESSESSYYNISNNPCYTNGKSRSAKTEWHPVSGGTISSFIGKEYVRTAQPVNVPSPVPKPMKLDSKEFPASELWGEEPKLNPAKDDHLQKDMEDFLFKLLGKGFQLNQNVIREVLDSCGYNMKKDLLCQHSAEIMDERVKSPGRSSKKCTDMRPTSGGLSCERTLQQSNPSGGGERKGPSTNKGELLRQPKDRNELQKEVLAALFNAPEKSEELPERTVKAVRRSKALGQVVTEPPRNVEPQPVADMVYVQQDNENDEDEEGSFQALHRAVLEYRGTMKAYCQAAVNAFAKGNHDLAGKLLKEGQFYCEKAREADEESNKKIFETRNRDTKNDVLLDLHEHGAKDAIRLLKCHLSSLSGIPSIKYLKVIIETSDEDSTTGARRRRVIMKLLEKESIEWIEEGIAGTILIPLDKINPKSLSFAER